MQPAVLLRMICAIVVIAAMPAYGWERGNHANTWKKGQTLKVCADKPPGDAAKQKQFTDALAEAMKEWNDAQAEFKGLKLETADKDCDVKIHWKDKAASWGATDPGGPPVDVTIESDDGLNQNGITRVLKHELGHVEGLGHSAGSALMKEDAYSSTPGQAPSAADLNAPKPFTAPTDDDKAGKKSLWGQTEKLSKSTATSRATRTGTVWNYEYVLTTTAGKRFRDPVTSFTLSLPLAVGMHDVTVVRLPAGWNAQFFSGAVARDRKSLDAERPSPGLLRMSTADPERGILPGRQARFNLRSPLGPGTGRAYTNSLRHDSDEFQLAVPARAAGEPAAPHALNTTRNEKSGAAFEVA